MSFSVPLWLCYNVTSLICDWRIQIEHLHNIKRTLFVAAKAQGIPRDDVLLHVDNTDSTLLHLAVESGVAKVLNYNGRGNMHAERQTSKRRIINVVFPLPERNANLKETGRELTTRKPKQN